MRPRKLGASAGAVAALALAMSALASHGRVSEAWAERANARVREGRAQVLRHRPSAMVDIAAGRFTMGFPSDAAAIERAIGTCADEVGAGAEFWCGPQANLWNDPQVAYALRYTQPHINAVPKRDVHLPAFAIDRFEVTIASYRVCVRSGRCDAAPLIVSGRTGHLDPELPVANVTFADARDYCAFVGKRLPTEAEWERAARSTDGREFAWGSHSRADGGNFGRMDAEAVRMARYMDLSPVSQIVDAAFDLAPDDRDGARLAVAPGTMKWSESSAGVYDLAGNVAEWVEDYYGEAGYEDLPADAPVRRAPYGGDTKRVVRGGSYLDLRLAARTYARSAADPFSRSPLIGFRCARDAAHHSWHATSM